MPEQDVTVSFLPSGEAVRVPKGTLLIEACAEAGVAVHSVCGGNGKCGKCIGRLVEGTIGSPSGVEKNFLSEEEIRRGHFLLCQRPALSDVVIAMEGIPWAEIGYVPDKGGLGDRLTEIDPHLTTTYHVLNAPTIDDQTGDLERVLRELPEGTLADKHVLERMPYVLRNGDFKATSVLFHGRMIAIEEGNTASETYGIALDIGTTTVAGYLVDLFKGRVLASASSANRQMVHGADVISRISHTLEKTDGLSEMKRLVLQTIDDIVGELLKKVSVPPECIYALSFVGNTVMGHFLLGVSAAGIASAPFVPAFTSSVITRAGDLGLRRVPESAGCILLPNVAGYVGADTVGLILSTGIYDLPGHRLAIDVGTNGEIVLSSKGRLLTCSTAAGPAFEGGCISRGMRAEPGAIYRVDMGEDVQVAVIGAQAPRGICGSGLIDAISEMIRLGVINSGGRIQDPSASSNLPDALRNRIRPGQKGYEFVLSDTINPVRLTQRDISELQLAKGAIRTGIDILLDEEGIVPGDLDEVLLAGAFGSRLRPESIMGIGLLPDIPLERIRSVGNAAGTGAIMALLSRRHFEYAVSLAGTIRHVELSMHNAFSGRFARAMIF